MWSTPYLDIQVDFFFSLNISHCKACSLPYFSFIVLFFFNLEQFIQLYLPSFLVFNKYVLYLIIFSLPHLSHLAVIFICEPFGK